jgi:flagellar hook-basal body complex protein FliE
MSPVAPVEPSLAQALVAAPQSAVAAPAPQVPESASFAEMLARAGADLEARVDHADELARRFIVDNDVPAHEVVIALEEARLAIELALEVRTRAVEAYREIMNMQL